MQTRLKTLSVALLLAALAGVTVLAYVPGLKGVFVFDSVERVVRNDTLRTESMAPRELLGAAYAGQADYPRRGLAYVSLALNYYLAGGRFDPFAFKLTNLVIHLLNGLLVFTLARLVIARWWQLGFPDARPHSAPALAMMACLAAGVWMLHPIQLTSVLYVVQRMTSLSATCVLIGAIAYLIARARLEQGRRYCFALMYGGVVGGTLVGFFFKQNALLLPAFVAVLELFLFEWRALSPGARRGLAAFFVATLVIPLIAGLAILISGTESTAGSYAFRDYDMRERLLTQARVLFFYLGLLALPDIRRLGLYHDDIGASAGLLEPWTTLVAVLGWTVMAILVVWGARRRAPWAFAVVWFLVGHAVESSILPLELVHEHRNYVPAIGVWMAFAFYAGGVWENAKRLRALLLPAIVGFVAALALITHTRAQAWRSPAALMESLARHHPASYRAANGYAFNSIPRDADLGVRFEAFRRAAALSEDAVSPLIEMSKISVALDYFLGAHGLAHAPSAAMPVAEMVLLAEPAHNAHLLAALDEAVARRLRVGRPRTDNIIALIALVDCSLHGSRECVSLRDSAARWHADALSNKRLPEHLRAALELSTAKIYAIAGESERAVSHARLAGRAAEKNLNYRLQEASLYALLERWDELGSVLEEIREGFPVRAQADPMFRDLNDRYENR
ncbi:MAG: hypothetical protein GTO67_01165 [Gammaproteobacteria bacterium]|nr:hypothetical protein [Gammaproteobacteria bacterium]NIM73694.1 hypothetical protein [Gammaproteobacteria bacterium]NIN37368.1 hypothetical protein [Gammaproteobacteria bacterium]NIO25527.1 hypothetical protein [Gammaproteobacteria bacterium]NIO66202.1 hypothetical protein [Gammaproteobacteria bacterium]